MTNILFVLLLTLASLVLLLTIYVYLFWKKIHNQLRSRKKAMWVKQNSHDIDNCLTTGRGSHLVIVTEEYQFEALEDKLSEFLSNFKLETDFNPLHDFVERHLIPKYKKQLRHRHWSTRMNALYFIDLFQIKAMQDELIGHLSSKLCSSEERYQIYLMLASFEYPKLLELLQKSKEIPSFLLTEVMSRVVHQGNIDQYVNNFFQYEDSWKEAILDVVRDKNLRSAELQLLLEQIIESRHSELRIRGLKTIASLGYISSIDPIIRRMESMIGSGQWDHPRETGEKLMLARLMGSIRHEDFMPFLLRLVGDKVYSVRSEAAKSIRKYKDGIRILETITFTHTDPYARSISQEWMERSMDYE